MFLDCTQADAEISRDGTLVLSGEAVTSKDGIPGLSKRAQNRLHRDEPLTRDQGPLGVRRDGVIVNGRPITGHGEMIARGRTTHRATAVKYGRVDHAQQVGTGI